MTLTEFLLARITEDEAVARELHDYGDDKMEFEAYRSPDWRDGIEHVAVSRARVLAECEAKRAIIEQSFVTASFIDNEWGYCCHSADAIRTGMVGPDSYGDPSTPLTASCTALAEAECYLKPLAAVYADHEDYLPEWKP
jgi:hypothetical protein